MSLPDSPRWQLCTGLSLDSNDLVEAIGSSQLPIFEIIDGNKHFKIYLSGKVEGFGVGAKHLNLIKPFLSVVKARVGPLSQKPKAA